MLAVAATIGILDDLQVRYLDIADWGIALETLYQTLFMVAAAAGAYFVLRHKDWDLRRNLSNLMMAVPVAAIADNVSIDAGTLKLYFIQIPSQGYEWRREVFSHTSALNNIAQLVNQQSIAPGVIDGYLAAIGIAAGYGVLQYLLYKRSKRRSLSLIGAKSLHV